MAKKKKRPSPKKKGKSKGPVLPYRLECAYDKLVKIEDLKLNPKNPNQHPKDQIEDFAKIMKKNGVRRAIRVSTLSGMVSAGHGQIMAMKLNGWTVAPVDLQDYKNAADEWNDVCADNTMGQRSKMDMSLVDKVVFEDFGPDHNVDSMGIKDYEGPPPPDKKGKCDEDEAPRPPVKARCKRGDIFEIGNHRVLCGDATDPKSYEKLMGKKKADLVVTDPPYNVGVNDDSEESLKKRNRRSDGLKVQNDKMKPEDFDQFLANVFYCYHKFMADGASLYMFYADSMTIPFMTKFKEAGFHFAQNCIWVKQQFVMTRKDYHYKHEPVMYGWKLGAGHSWMADRKQSSVWNFDRPFKSELHPTMKPINLLEYPIKNSSSAGKVVLDAFGGSGSTLIACEKTSRSCYTMEIDPKYVDVIVSRWCKFTGQRTVMKNGKKMKWSVKLGPRPPK